MLLVKKSNASAARVCLPGQAWVDANSWGLAGPDTLPESQGNSWEQGLRTWGCFGVKWMLGAPSNAVWSQTILSYLFCFVFFLKSLSDGLCQSRGEEGEAKLGWGGLCWLPWFLIWGPASGAVAKSKGTRPGLTVWAPNWPIQASLPWILGKTHAHTLDQELVSVSQGTV